MRRWYIITAIFILSDWNLLSSGLLLFNFILFELWILMLRFSQKILEKPCRMKCFIEAFFSVQRGYDKIILYKHVTIWTNQTKHQYPVNMTIWYYDIKHHLGSCTSRNDSVIFLSVFVSFFDNIDSAVVKLCRDGAGSDSLEHIW